MSKPAVGIAFVVDFRNDGIEAVRVTAKEPLANGAVLYLVRGRWDKKSRRVGSHVCFDTLEAAKESLLASIRRKVRDIKSLRFNEEAFLVY